MALDIQREKRRKRWRGRKIAPRGLGGKEATTTALRINFSPAPILLLSAGAVGVGGGREKTRLEERQMPFRISSNYDREGLKERRFQFMETD